MRSAGAFRVAVEIICHEGFLSSKARKIRARIESTAFIRSLRRVSTLRRLQIKVVCLRGANAIRHSAAKRTFPAVSIRSARIILRAEYQRKVCGGWNLGRAFSRGVQAAVDTMHRRTTVLYSMGDDTKIYRIVPRLSHWSILSSVKKRKSIHFSFGTISHRGRSPLTLRDQLSRSREFDRYRDLYSVEKSV